MSVPLNYTRKVQALLPFQNEQFNDVYLVAGSNDDKPPIKYKSPTVITDKDGNLWYTWNNVALADGVIFLYVKQKNPTVGQLAYLYGMAAWVPDGHQTSETPLQITPLTTAQALCFLSWHVRSLDLETARSILPHLKDEGPLQEIYANLSQGIFQSINSDGTSTWNQTASSTDLKGKIRLKRKTHLRYVFTDDVRAQVKILVAAVASQIQNDPQMQDKKWVRHDGKPAIHRAPAETGGHTDAIVVRDLPQQSTGQLTNEENYTQHGGFWWRIDPDDPGHGLTVYPGSLSFNSSNDLSFDVNNILARYYSVYVTFYDDDGNVIKTPKVNGQPWNEILPDEIRSYFQNEKDYPGEKFLTLISSVWLIAGVPVPVNKTAITFPWADGATKATLKFGSLGVIRSDTDGQAWLMGGLLTVVLNYLLPMVFMAIGARYDIGAILKSWLKNPNFYFALLIPLEALIAAVISTKDPVQTLKLMGEQAASIVGSVITAKGVEALREVIAAKFVESETEDSIPFVGEAFEVAALLIDMAQVIETTVEVAVNPAVIEIDVKRAFNLTLDISSPEYGHFQRWPDEAATYRAVVKFDHQSSIFVQSAAFPAALKDHSTDPLTIQFIGLPAGGTFTVEVGLYGGDELCCSTYATPKPLAAGDQTVKGQFTYVQHPLDAKTRYKHERALAYNNNQYALAQNPPTLTKTLTDLGGENPINRLGQISFDAWNDILGYSWEPTSPAPYRIQEFCNIPGKVNSTLRSAQVDSGLVPRLVYNPFEHKEGETLPRRFWLDPRDGQNFLREVKETATGFNLDQSQSWGRFPFAPLDMDFHPNGYVVAIGDPAGGSGGGLMVLQLGRAVNDANAPLALPVVRQGTRPGLLQNQVAVSVTPDSRVLVLEAGASPRIQAFDVKGNTVPSFRTGSKLFSLANVTASDLDAGAVSAAVRAAFQQNNVTLYDGATLSVRIKGQQWVVQDRYSDATPSSLAWIIVNESGSLNVYQFSPSLDLPAGNTPLDLAMELKGYIYVLSYGEPSDASSYRLDIYDPLGTSVVCSTSNFNVGALVVDPWRYTYTLDFDTLTGPNGAEPMVSEWIPQESKSGD